MATVDKWQSNPFLYTAYQKVAELRGAQAAEAATYKILDWAGDTEGTEATVRVDVDSFTGPMHGEIKMKLDKDGTAFIPDPQRALRGMSISSPALNDKWQSNPFLYAAYQKVAELGGAQAAEAATYKITGWGGDLEGTEATVRVDVDSFTGPIHGEVQVKLDKEESYFIPDAKPALG